MLITSSRSVVLGVYLRERDQEVRGVAIIANSGLGPGIQGEIWQNSGIDVRYRVRMRGKAGRQRRIRRAGLTRNQHNAQPSDGRISIWPDPTGRIRRNGRV